MNRTLRFPLLGLAVVVVLFAGTWITVPSSASVPLAAVASTNSRVINAAIVWGEDRGIYGAKVDGSYRHLITRYKGGDPTDGYFSPEWSANGQKLTYWTVVSASCFVHVVSPTRGVRRTPGLGGDCNNDPTWSPDGRQIALSDGTPTITRRPISIFSLTSGRVRRLTKPALNDGDFAPDWSPDGNVVAFERDFGLREDRAVIYTTTLDGRERRISKGSSPSWSPDGQSLVFAARDTIYRVNADGSGRKKVAHLPGLIDGPSMSPDGRKILYSKRQSPRRSSIWVVNADGTSPTRLLTVPGNVLGVGWKPG